MIRASSSIIQPNFFEKTGPKVVSISFEIFHNVEENMPKTDESCKFD